MADIEYQAIDDNVVRAAAVGSPLPEIVCYYDADFRNQALRTNLNALYLAQDGAYNDSFSSVVVVSGTWELFVDSRFQGQSSRLTPGYYPNEAAMRLPNDSVSSFRCVSY